MRNQMSFGKRERDERPYNGARNSLGGGLDDSGFQSELMRKVGDGDNNNMLMQDGSQMGEEFSDECLFGEDNIEKLIDKKNNSFLRGSN